jgi:hypothetical protein
MEAVGGAVGQQQPRGGEVAGRITGAEFADSWNSGVVEGHVNRIKMLKRQLFGRAGFALLRKRVPLAPLLGCLFTGRAAPVRLEHHR